MVPIQTAILAVQPRVLLCQTQKPISRVEAVFDVFSKFPTSMLLCELGGKSDVYLTFRLTFYSN